MKLRRTALGVAVLAMVVGCQQHYPERSSVRAFGSESMFRNLRRAVYAARSEVQSMDLQDPCTMRIHWDDGKVRTYDLMRLRTVFPQDGDEDGDRYGLLVEGRKQGAQRMLIGTSQWGQYMMARASIVQLRGLCAVSRKGGGQEAGPEGASSG